MDELRHHDEELNEVYDELAMLWREVGEINARLDAGPQYLSLAEIEEIDHVEVSREPSWRCTNGDCAAWGYGVFPTGLVCPRCYWHPVELLRDPF